VPFINPTSSASFSTLGRLLSPVRRLACAPLSLSHSHPSLVHSAHLPDNRWRGLLPRRYPRLRSFTQVSFFFLRLFGASSFLYETDTSPLEQQRREDHYSLGVSGRGEAVSARGASSLFVDAVFLLFAFVPFVELVAQVATLSSALSRSMRPYPPVERKKSCRSSGSLPSKKDEQQRLETSGTNDSIAAVTGCRNRCTSTGKADDDKE
jgi:hypothetical protein